MAQLVSLPSPSRPDRRRRRSGREGRFQELFTAAIRNPHTRRAYVRADVDILADLKDGEDVNAAQIGKGKWQDDYLAGCKCVHASSSSSLSQSSPNAVSASNAASSVGAFQQGQQGAANGFERRRFQRVNPAGLIDLDFQSL